MMTNRQLIDAFLAEKSISSAKRTYVYYKENLDKFYDYSQDHFFTIQEGHDPVEISYLDLPKSLYLEYLTFLKSTGIKNTSLNTYHRAIRTFCNWLVKEELLNKAWTDVKMPRSDAGVIVPLTNREVQRIDIAISKNFYHKRNYLIIHLMLDCGLRRQEVINLKCTDYVLEEDAAYLVIRQSKGNKNRFVPVPENIRKELSEYRFYSDQKHLLLSDSGEKLTESVIKNIFRKLKLQTEIDRLHPHLLRHTFATSFIAGGGNMEYLRIYLGHADYAITQKYLHISMQMQIVGSDIYKLDKIFFKNYNNKGE